MDISCALQQRKSQIDPMLKRLANVKKRRILFMKRRMVSLIILTLLANMLMLAFQVQPSNSNYTWTETIYIRADGSVFPDTALSPVLTT
jgi:hypothetical protein